MGTRSLALRAFLGIYIVLLLYHLFTEAHEITVLAAGALLLGVGAAVYAHSRNGWVLYSLLFLHMAVEWIGYGMRSWVFLWPDSAFELTHLAFDICFLFIVAKMQWKQGHLLMFLGTLVILGTISVLVPRLLPTSHAPHGLEVGTLEFLILGGILGCTGFHLVRPFKTSQENC